MTDLYPGSKTPVATFEPPEALPIDELLDQLAQEQTPKLIYSLDGKDVQFFERGALAYILQRKPGTLRLWESKGILPEPQFRKERPLAHALAGKIAYRIVGGQQRVGFRVPLRIVDTIEDSSQLEGARPKQTVEAETEFGCLDLTGIRRTDRGHGVRPSRNISMTRPVFARRRESESKRR